MSCMWQGLHLSKSVKSSPKECSPQWAVEWSRKQGTSVWQLPILNPKACLPEDSQQVHASKNIVLIQNNVNPQNWYESLIWNPTVLILVWLTYIVVEQMLPSWISLHMSDQHYRLDACNDSSMGGGKRCHQSERSCLDRGEDFYQGCLFFFLRLIDTPHSMYSSPWTQNYHQLVLAPNTIKV